MPTLGHLHKSRHLLVFVFIFVLAGCGSATPSSQADSRHFVIGEISVIDPTYITDLHNNLAQLGYVVGKNVTYTPDLLATPAPTPIGTPVATAAVTASAPPVNPNDPAVLLAAAQNLVAEKVDLIIAYGTGSAQAAQKATAGTTIPVVFVGALNPVDLGIVKSLANNEGNITGVAGTSSAYAQQLEWLVRISPTIKRVYIPYASAQVSSVAAALKAIQDYATKANIQVTAAALPTAKDTAAALANFPDTDAIMLLPFSPQTSDFIALAIQRKLPLSGFTGIYATQGALLTYNYSSATLSPLVATQIDRILKGAKPSDLPVQLAPNALVINLKTAQAIGLTISNTILQQATTLIR